MTPPTSRPHALPVRAGAIPRGLPLHDRWVLWRWWWDPRRQRWTKPPFQVRTGQRASTTDPTTWTSLERATAAYLAGGWDGIGVVLVPDDGLTGIDLDHCLDLGTGQPKPWAAVLVQRFASYAELSPSGTGIRILVRGSLAGLLPDGRLGLRRGPIELYSGGRYLTITGHALTDPPSPLAERQAQLAAYVAELRTAEQRTDNRLNAQPISGGQRLDDAAVLRHARAARNGAKFIALFDRGDCAGYDGDASRADQALLSLLAFWTQCPDQLDRLFRQSACYRGKWERSDYRKRSIALALAGGEAYDPQLPASSRQRTVPMVRGRRPIVDLPAAEAVHGR